MAEKEKVNESSTVSEVKDVLHARNISDEVLKILEGIRTSLSSNECMRMFLS